MPKLRVRLPKLRVRWTAPGTDDATGLGRDLPPAVACGVLCGLVVRAVEQVPDEAGFFARLRADGVLVRLRFNQFSGGTCRHEAGELALNVSGFCTRVTAAWQLPYRPGKVFMSRTSWASHARYLRVYTFAVMPFKLWEYRELPMCCKSKTRVAGLCRKVRPVLLCRSSY